MSDLPSWAQAPITTPKKDAQSWRDWVNIAEREAATLRANVDKAEAAIVRIDKIRDITPEAKLVRTRGARAKVQVEARKFLGKHHGLRHRGLPGAVDRMMPKRPTDAAESIFKLRELDQLLSLTDARLASRLRDDPEARGLLFQCGNKTELSTVGDRIKSIASLSDIRAQVAHDSDPAQAKDVAEAITALDSSARVVQDILADASSGQPLLSDAAKAARTSTASRVHQAAHHHWHNPEWSADEDRIWNADTSRVEQVAAATPEPTTIQL